ncbi:MAG: elongation factor G [Myxococcota bacterium]
MQKVEIPKTRNFALIGHAGDGKTSLGDALLHRAGAVSDLGRVDDGSSALNTLPEERDGHTSSVTSHVFSFAHDGHALTLVDTPGDSNYQGDGLVALQALDAAVLVVSAVDGAKVGTEKMWRAARASSLPAVAFVNGLDQDRADLQAAVASLAELEGLKPVLVSWPVGSGSDLRAVVDLARMKTIGSDGKEGDIPADLADEAETRRMELVEAVAECDDDLLEKYLEEGELADDEVAKGLVAGVRARAIVPVVAGSAATEAGVDVALRALTEWLPSPADRPAWITADGEAEVAASADAPFSAVVFKTIIDRYAGTLSVLRVVSGTLQHDSSVTNATRDAKVRVGKLMHLQGEKHEDAVEAGPGDIVAVAKLKDVHTGDVLTADKGGVKLPSPTIPQGVLSYAIQAKSQGDEDKVYSSLGRLVEEDPSLSLGREASTGEFLLTGMGELHIRTTVKKLKRLFDVEVDLKTPKVPYRETISKSAQHVEGKLKKQTGGKGMFGVCFLDVEPMPRGEGFEFVDKIVGGAIPRGLIPAVEKGVVEAMERGPLAGYPVVDIRVRCVDGKHHAVDSNEMAFKLAGSFGFKAAVEQAKPKLLEPIMTAEVSVPDEHVGDVMGDISSRRGRVQTSEARGSATVIVAQVPMSEMLEYASTLTSLTGGTGAFHMEFSHYDEVPAAVADKIITEAKAAATDEG